MTSGDRFERTDILGSWYPTDCVVALFGETEAHNAVEALRQAGFADDDIRHWTADEMRAMHEDIEQGHWFKRFLRNTQRALAEDSESVDAYQPGLERGQSIVAVYAPDEEQQHRATELFRANFGSYIKYFGANTLVDL